MSSISKLKSKIKLLKKSSHYFIFLFKSCRISVLSLKASANFSAFLKNSRWSFCVMLCLVSLASCMTWQQLCCWLLTSHSAFWHLPLSSPPSVSLTSSPQTWPDLQMLYCLWSQYHEPCWGGTSQTWLCKLILALEVITDFSLYVLRFPKMLETICYTFVLRNYFFCWSLT